MFKDDYTTPMPETFAAVVASTFALVAIVFFVYDWLVQKRNKELAVTAARSDKLVASLFPAEIKEQILKQQDEQKSPKNKNKSLTSVTNDSGSALFKNASPLAKEYPKATILFSDLVGFTKWSSTRTPEPVFKLLETFYAAFDAIGMY